MHFGHTAYTALEEILGPSIQDHRWIREIVQKADEATKEPGEIQVSIAIDGIQLDPYLTIIKKGNRLEITSLSLRKSELSDNNVNNDDFSILNGKIHISAHAIERFRERFHDVVLDNWQLARKVSYLIHKGEIVSTMQKSSDILVRFYWTIPNRSNLVIAALAKPQQHYNNADHRSEWICKTILTPEQAIQNQLLMVSHRQHGYQFKMMEIFKKSIYGSDENQNKNNDLAQLINELQKIKETDGAIRKSILLRLFKQSTIANGRCIEIANELGISHLIRDTSLTREQVDAELERVREEVHKFKENLFSCFFYLFSSDEKQLSCIVKSLDSARPFCMVFCFNVQELELFKVVKPSNKQLSVISGLVTPSTPLQSISKNLVIPTVKGSVTIPQEQPSNSLGIGYHSGPILPLNLPGKVVGGGICKCPCHSNGGMRHMVACCQPITNTPPITTQNVDSIPNAKLRKAIRKLREKIQIINSGTEPVKCEKPTSIAVKTENKSTSGVNTSGTSFFREELYHPVCYKGLSPHVFMKETFNFSKDIPLNIISDEQIQKALYYTLVVKDYCNYLKKFFNGNESDTITFVATLHDQEYQFISFDGRTLQLTMIINGITKIVEIMIVRSESRGIRLMKISDAP